MKYISILILIVSLSIYISSVAQHPVNIADSAELITAAYNRGIAHPPGYPLYTGFLFLVMKFPLISNPIFAAHLTSAIFQSLSLVCFFLCCYELTKKTSISVISTAILGFSYFFWEQATYAEVFGLHNLLLGLILWFILRTNLPKRELIISILIGLAAAHHQTIIFIIPGIIYFFYQQPKRPQWIKYLFISGITFLLPYLILTLFYDRAAPLSWQFDPTLSGIWQLIMRQVYAPVTQIPTGSSHALSSIMTLFQFTTQHYTFPAIILAIIGLYHLYQKNRTLCWFFSLIIIVSGPMLAAYMKFPLPTSNQVYFYSSYLGLRMFSTFRFVLALMIAPGLVYITQFKFLRLPALISCVFIIGYLFIHNYPLVDKRTSVFDSQLSTEILESLPQNSLLISDSDLSFGLLQMQTLNRVRPDILIIPTAMHMRWGYLQQQLPKEIFELKGFYALILSITNWGLSQGKPVFVLDPRPQFLDQMKAFNYHLTPHGYALRISTELQSIPAYSYALSREFSQKLIPKEDLWAQYNLAKLDNIHNLLLLFTVP